MYRKASLTLEGEEIFFIHMTITINKKRLDQILVRKNEVVMLNEVK